MYLLAVSGGPDSIFLLNEYHRRNIVVAHVNYNLRSSSKRDEKIVKDYCNYHGIKLEILNVTEKPKGNLEKWARDIRYNFFKKIYIKYNCKALLIGQHKDDFLETALMQQRSGRNPLFFGIKKKSYRLDMKILRPFINLYWKSDIIYDLESKNIKYGIDETNNDLSLTRNKIRDEIKTWTLKEKKDHFNWFKMSNKILKKKERKINAWFNVWSRSNFSVKSFRSINHYKEELVYKYIHNHFEDINLSSKKLKSIILFIEGVEGNKKFKLNDKHYILKKDGVIKPF